MPSFTYRAVNADNKEIRGQVDAADLDAAKNALEDTNLEVVEIHEASRQSAQTQELSQQPVLKTTFAFEGKDSAGTVRRGTIQSETKYQAFEKLKQDQKLFLTMLSPLGVTPQYRDNDLENWQRKDNPTAAKQPSAPIRPDPVVAASPAKPKSIGFTSPEPVKAAITPAERNSVPVTHQYHPLVSTLRLYAGWLLAWYGLFVALGYYAHVRALAWDLPFVEAFFVSPMIFSFVVAIFLFLMLGSIHRAINGHWVSRIVCGLIGLGALIEVQRSIQ